MASVDENPEVKTLGVEKNDVSRQMGTWEKKQEFPCTIHIEQIWNSTSVCTYS